MTHIYTAGAINSGFYVTAVVAAADKATATSALAAFFANKADDGGEYIMDEVTARVADEDGCYVNGGGDSYDLDSREWAVGLAVDDSGKVAMLDSGANG